MDPETPTHFRVSAPASGDDRLEGKFARKLLASKGEAVSGIEQVPLERFAGQFWWVELTTGAFSRHDILETNEIADALDRGLRVMAIRGPFQSPRIASERMRIYWRAMHEPSGPAGEGSGCEYPPGSRSVRAANGDPPAMINPRLQSIQGPRLELVRQVHTFDIDRYSVVHDLAVTPGSRFVVSLSLTDLRFWDLGSGTCARTIDLEKADLTHQAVAITPDGSLVVVGGGSVNEDALRHPGPRTIIAPATPRGWLKLYDLDGALRNTILLPAPYGRGTGAIRAVAVTFDGRFAVSDSGKFDSQPRLWNLSSGECERVFEGHDASVEAVATTADGLFFLSGSSDASMKLWNIASGACLHTFEGHTDAVTAVAVAHDGRFALSGSADATLCLWELGSGELIRRFEGHEESVIDVAFTPGARFVLSGSADRTARVWDLETGTCVRSIEANQCSLNAVAMTPDGRHVIGAGGEPTTTGDNALRIWRLWWDFDLERYGEEERRSAGALVQADEEASREVGRERFAARPDALTPHEKRVFGTPDSTVRSLAVTPDGRFLLSAGQTLRLWEIATGDCVHEFEGYMGSADALEVTPDGKCAVAAGRDRVCVWEIATGKRRFMTNRGGRAALAVTPDSRFVASANGYIVELRDITTGNLVRTFVKHDTWVSAVAVTPDGRFLISGSEGRGNAVGERTLRLWSLENGESIHRFDGISWGMGAVVPTPDGRFLLSSVADETLRLWDVARGVCLRRFAGHTSWITAVAVTPDGRHAVSGSGDKTVRIWEIESGRVAGTIDGHEGAVTAVAVTSDGRHLISSDLKQLRLWELAHTYG